MYAIEMELARLYSLFAVRFPEDAVFWKKIAADEVVHGDNIKRIISLISENNLVYIIGKSFSHKAAVLILENTRLYTDDAKMNCLTKEDAFSIACGIEKAIIESKYMDYLLTNNKEYNDFIEQIVREEADHKGLFEKI